MPRPTPRMLSESPRKALSSGRDSPSTAKRVITMSAIVRTPSIFPICDQATNAAVLYARGMQPAVDARLVDDTDRVMTLVAPLRM